MAKRVPKTLLIQCTKCELICRIPEDEVENPKKFPKTYCNQIKTHDLRYRRDECIKYEDKK